MPCLWLVDNTGETCSGEPPLAIIFEVACMSFRLECNGTEESFERILKKQKSNRLSALDAESPYRLHNSLMGIPVFTGMTQFPFCFFINNFILD